MSTKKEFILIPYWIEDTLQRNNASLQACLDFPKLKGVCSLNDLIGFQALQGCVPQILGKDAHSPFSTYTLFGTWHASMVENDTEMHDYLTKNVTLLSEDATFIAETRARLFSPESKHGRYPEPFRVVDLSNRLSGVVIYPGFFTDTPNPALQFALIEAVLKVLYVYDSHSEVSQTSLFLRYLELLSKK